LGHVINMYFRADLTAVLNGHNFGLCSVTHPKAKGSFVAVRPPDRWTFHTSYNPDEGETPEQFTHDRCLELIRTTVGTSELSVEILSILPWEAAAGIADKFQFRRSPCDATNGRVRRQLGNTGWS